jgi:HK97 gp10 family phage protein
MFKMRVNGVKWWARYLDEAMNAAAMEQQVKAARLVAASARAAMKQAPIVVGPRGGITYIPSEPGTPPHVRTGTLRRDIKVLKLRKTVVVRMGLSGWYGIVHEFGGKFHPPRPFIRPAFDRISERYPDLFRDLPLRKTYNDHGLSKLGGGDE